MEGSLDDRGSSDLKGEGLPGAENRESQPTKTGPWLAGPPYIRAAPGHSKEAGKSLVAGPEPLQLTGT